ncbi:MAG TPA: hypothetical protein PJ988_11395 [Anaerolinea sp.]|nr:hypothetical protein [Anaerolinea sp.]
MNGQNRKLSLILVVLAVLLLPIQPVAAQTIRTDFTGTETFIEDLDFGVESFPAEKLFHVRGAISRFEISASDPRVSGQNLVTINWNFRFVDPPVFATGIMWGTFKISNPGGAWEGTWTGVRDENGYSFFQFVGKGSGGYEGMKIRFHAERLTPDASQPEVLSGSILEPGG